MKYMIVWYFFQKVMPEMESPKTKTGNKNIQSCKEHKMQASVLFRL